MASAGLEFETFDSLEAMVDAADVTVLGTVVDGMAGERHVSEEDDGDRDVQIDMQLVVRVDEVLAGKVGDGSDMVRVVVGPFDEGEVTPELWGRFLGQQSLFALRRAGSEVRTEWGIRHFDPETFAQNLYYVVYSRGLLDDDAEGNTVAPWAEKTGWITEIIGQPFDQVLDQIRAAGRR